MADQMTDGRSVVLAGVWFDGDLCVDHLHGSMPSAVVSHGPGKVRPYESGGAWAAEIGHPRRPAAAPSAPTGGRANRANRANRRPR